MSKFWLLSFVFTYIYLIFTRVLIVVFLSGKLFFNTKCPSVCQRHLGGKVIFSSAKQGIRLIFNSMSTQFIIYLVRRSVCLSCCNILIHMYFLLHSLCPFVHQLLFMDGIILVILGIFLLVLRMYYLKRHTEKYYIKCTANCQKGRGHWAFYYTSL